MAAGRPHPIAPGQQQILRLPAMPAGHTFQSRPIQDNLHDVEDLPDGFPIELELRGPEGRGEAAEDALLDVLADMPLAPPKARSARLPARTRTRRPRT